MDYYLTMKTGLPLPVRKKSTFAAIQHTPASKHVTVHVDCYLNSM